MAREQEIRWEDTVMGERELMKFELKYIRGDTFYWGAAFDKALKAQAKLSFEAGRREVVGYATKFLQFAEYGDYSNGVEFFGVDEGRVKARELLDRWREEWQAKLKEWGIEKEAKE